MGDPVITWALVIGALSVVLGFIALLASRIYISTPTNAATETAATEVDVPFFGKIKSNYPALVLVLLGTALAAYAVKTNSDLRGKQVDADSAIATVKAGAPGDDQWVITGRLVSGDGKDVDWERGVFTLFYGSPDIAIDPDGRFQIKLMIKKGQSLEEYLQRIDYSNYASGSMSIYPPTELDKFRRNDTSSLLENETKFVRAYKPTKVIKWNTSP